MIQAQSNSMDETSIIVEVKTGSQLDMSDIERFGLKPKLWAQLFTPAPNSHKLSTISKFDIFPESILLRVC